MRLFKKEKPLTQEEKDAIWKAIGKAMQPDDRHPNIVIAEDYKGDEEKYLRVMAAWHGVPISSSTEGGKNG